MCARCTSTRPAMAVWLGSVVEPPLEIKSEADGAAAPEQVRSSCGCTLCIAAVSVGIALHREAALRVWKSVCIACIPWQHKYSHTSGTIVQAAARPATAHILASHSDPARHN